MATSTASHDRQAEGQMGPSCLLPGEEMRWPARSGQVRDAAELSVYQATRSTSPTGMPN